MRSAVEANMEASGLKRKAPEIRRLARKHGIRRVRVFGSRATAAARGWSDLDLLVELAPRRDLLDLVEFKLDLEKLLEIDVDVLTRDALSPYLRERVLREALPL